MCGCFSCAPPLGTWSASQVHALTGNRTSHPFLHCPSLNPLSHTRQGGFLLSLQLSQIVGGAWEDAQNATNFSTPFDITLPSFYIVLGNVASQLATGVLQRYCSYYVVADLSPIKSPDPPYCLHSLSKAKLLHLTSLLSWFNIIHIT